MTRATIKVNALSEFGSISVVHRDRGWIALTQRNTEGNGLDVVVCPPERLDELIGALTVMRDMQPKADDTTYAEIWNNVPPAPAGTEN